MRRERPGQTLQATALVHEAYLRLAGAGTPWHDKRHFVGIAARSMRQILVERARARGAQKRWAGIEPRVADRRARGRRRTEDAMLPALDEALTRLEQIDPEQARIVELRYFAGLSIEETADALGMSPATLKRRWALARAWLFRELSGPAMHDARSSGGASAICSRRRSIAIRPARAAWLGARGRRRSGRARRSAVAARAPLARRRVPRRSRSPSALPDLLDDDEPLDAGRGRRRLHDRPRARARRHGPRLSGDGRAARPHGGAEGAARRT